MSNHLHGRAAEAELPAVRRSPEHELTVMQSFGPPRHTTNPYITMLDAALAATPGMRHVRFDWRTALFGRYEVFHWHWPEGKLHGTTWWKTTGKRLLTVLLLLRHRLSGVAVVRTVHNVELPDVPRMSRRILLAIDRGTDFRITLNSVTAVPDGAASTMIPHGHYRDWYANCVRSDVVPGRIGTFGGIRRYKSVDALFDAYADAVAAEPSLSLRIGGRPSSDELADALRARAAVMPGVELQLAFLEDEELVDLVTSSQLIVLAYRFMHNSGSVLAALSLDRPVLVPRNEVNEALAREVGDGWVVMYDGALDAAALVDAVRATAPPARDSSPRPDLSQREWDDAGVAHLRAYRSAVAARTGAAVLVESSAS